MVLSSSTPSPPAGQVAPQLERLVQLQLLEELAIRWSAPGWGTPLPKEWVQQGAFPRLTWCVPQGRGVRWGLGVPARLLPAAQQGAGQMVAGAAQLLGLLCPFHRPTRVGATTSQPCRLEIGVPHLHGSIPLPGISPGALPALRELYLDFPSLRSTLPGSWGDSPGVLPSLKVLELQLQVEGGLPREWGLHGLRRLQSLIVISHSPRLPRNAAVGELMCGQAWTAAELSRGQAAAAAAGAGGAPLPAAQAPPTYRPTLPEQWGLGFKSLASLVLMRLDLVGSIPASWLKAGSFPQLAEL